MGRDWDFSGLKSMFHFSDENLIIFRSAERERYSCYLPSRGMGHWTTQCGVICKKRERVFQNIKEVINLNEKLDWAQNTAVGNSCLHWERWKEDSTDRNTLTARVEEVRNNGMKVAVYATGRACRAKQETDGPMLGSGTFSICATSSTQDDFEWHAQ